MGEVSVPTSPPQMRQLNGEILKMRNLDMKAWELFCENVGDIVDSPDFQQLAIGMVEKLDGHRLALILMARFLKNVTDICLWELALSRLSLQLSVRVKGINPVMINTWMLLWEQMDGTKRQCIRHHALHSKGKKTRRALIISNWIDAHLVSTTEEGIRIIQELIDACVFKSVGSYFVSLHGQIYGIVKKLFRDRNMVLLSRCGLGLTEPPNEVEWNVSEIHLTDNNLSELLESPKCPCLAALHLQKNPDLTAIPSTFFDNMSLLQTLDLSYTSIKRLPESLPTLITLRELFLRGCELLMDLSPQVGQLQNLEKLDLDETRIIELPATVGNLTKLKFLRVAFYGYENRSKKELQHETIIHSGTISNLSELIELSIDVDPHDERWERVATTVIQEVCSLGKLQHLKLYLPDLEMLWRRSIDGTSLIHYPLSQFRFTIGHHKDRLISQVPREVEVRFEEWKKCFKFVNGKAISAEVKSSLKEATSFFLDSHATATSLSDFGIENVKQLRFCLLSECNQIQSIIDTEKYLEGSKSKAGLYCGKERAFQNLRYLIVYYMNNLQCISRAPTKRYCLSSLRLLALHKCPKLSCIFSPALIANMRTLEELIIKDCPQVTSLVISTDEASSFSASSTPKYRLSRLKRMSLLFLPKLNKICNGLLSAPRLEKIAIYYCRHLRNMATIETQSEELNIKGEVTWWNALEGKKPVSFKNEYRFNIKFKEIERKRDLITQLVEDEFIVLPYKQER